MLGFTKFGVLNTITLHSYDDYKKDMVEAVKENRVAITCMIDDSADLFDS